MMYKLFITPFMVSFAISAALLVLFIFLNNKKTLKGERLSDRHVNQNNISRFGGAALIISFIATLLLNKPLVITVSLASIFIALGMILVFGIIDDIKQLSWKTQLLFQSGIVLFIYFLGVRLQYITNPFGGILFLKGYIIGLLIILFWILLLMNSINWIDGIDGVSSGITLIGGITIFILSLRPEVNQPPVSIITAALTGSVLALLLFNFYPAKIMAGTSGAMFMGFMLAVLAVFAGAKIATTLLVMAVPIIDAFWVIGERIRSKRSIFLPDKRHLHFKLMELGWSQRKICIFYYTVTALISIIALNTGAIGKAATFILFGVVMFAMLFWVKNKVSQKTQN